MIPQMSPYTPELYQPDSYGRYRKYPPFTKTPIPGAGYKVGELVWAEQELNLNGGPPQTYGSYAQVPLRGLGAASAGLRTMVPRAPATMAARPQTMATAQTALRPPGAPPGLRAQATPSIALPQPSMPQASMAPKFRAVRHGSQQHSALAPSRAETMVSDIEAIARTAPSDMYSMGPTRKQARARTGLDTGGGATIARGPSDTLYDPYDDDPYESDDDSGEPLERRDIRAHELGQYSEIAPLSRSIAAPRLKMQASTTLAPAPSGGGSPSSNGGGSQSPDDYMGWNVEEEIRKAAEAASQATTPTEPTETQPSFFMRKAGPVPYWAIGLGALAVVGGGTYWYVRSR